MKLRMALVATLLGSSLAWADSTCEADLAAAAADDYDVVTLSKSGHANLTILGEGHYKTKRSAELGRRVLSHFEHVGIESREEDSTWGMRLRGRFQPNREPVIDTIRRAEASLPSRRTEVSTIFETLRLYMRWEIYQGVRDAQRKNLELLLESLKVETDEEFLAAKDLVVMTRVEAMDLIRRRLAGPLDPKDAPPAIVRYRLEASHRPNLVEQASSLEPGHPEQFWGWWSVALTAAVALPAEYAPLSLLSFVPSAYRWVSDRVVTDFRQYHSPWVRTLFPLVGGPIHGRDRTMAAAAYELSTKLPGAEVLIIVGRGHVIGVVENLRRRGFVP